MKSALLWILLAVIWSGSFAAVRIGVESFTPMVLVSGRMIIGALFLAIIIKMKNMRVPMQIEDIKVYTVSGCLGSVIPFLLISYGEIHVESGLAALLMGITPVATVLFAPLMLADEKLSPNVLIGSAVGVMGLVVLVGSSVITGLGSHVLGQAAIIGAALCYAATTIYVRACVKLPPLVIATGSTAVGAILILLMTIILENPFNTTGSLRSIVALMYLGLLATATATLIYFYLVPRLGAQRMSQINFVVPVLGALIGILLMGEQFRINVVLSLIMVLLAIFLVTKKQKLY